MESETNIEKTTNCPKKIYKKIDENKNAEQEVIEIGDLVDSSATAKNSPVDTVDGRNNRLRNKGNLLSTTNDNYYYHTKKSVAEGMMDISLLTANANQLKFLLFYNQNSTTFWPAITLIVLSLVFQIIIGFTLIFRRRYKTHGQRRQVSHANEILILLMFLVTIINIMAAVLTTTD